MTAAAHHSRMLQVPGRDACSDECAEKRGRRHIKRPPGFGGVLNSPPTISGRSGCRVACGCEGAVNSDGSPKRSGGRRNRNWHLPPPDKQTQTAVQPHIAARSLPPKHTDAKPSRLKSDFFKSLSQHRSSPLDAHGPFPCAVEFRLGLEAAEHQRPPGQRALSMHWARLISCLISRRLHTSQQVICARFLT